jgi:hypothetical protein
LRFKASPSKKFTQDPILKKPNRKRAGGLAQGVGPEFKSQDCNLKKRKKRNSHR